MKEVEEGVTRKQTVPVKDGEQGGRIQRRRKLLLLLSRFEKRLDALNLMGTLSNKACCLLGKTVSHDSSTVLPAKKPDSEMYKLADSQTIFFIQIAFKVGTWFLSRNAAGARRLPVPYHTIHR
eukprot:scaffold16664_cov161-Amphora_coffeaeformis.AAC.4